MLFGNSKLFRSAFYAILVLTAMNCIVYFQLMNEDEISYDQESADRSLELQFQGEIVYVEPFLRFAEDINKNPSDLISPLVALRDVVNGFGIDASRYLTETSFHADGDDIVWLKESKRRRTRYQPR